jgi:hypothetical protein
MSNANEYVLPPQSDDDLTVTANGGGGDFPECPAGAWAGVCVDVVYRGMQDNKFDPSKGPQPKISIHMMIEAYQSEDSDDYARRSDGKRFVLSAWFTRSMHPKATLRKTLAAWRGKDFDDDAAETFNLNKLVGAFALVNVIHVAGKDGRPKAVIDSIARLPRGVPTFTPDPYVRAKDRKPGDEHHPESAVAADDGDSLPF